MKKLTTVLVMVMVIFTTNSFAQTTEMSAKKIKEDKEAAHTYFDLMVNMVSTNLNYGNINGTLKDYKKSTNGIQAGVSFKAGVTNHFSFVSELYYMRKGGKLKADNPLTGNESMLRLNTMELSVLARLHVGKFYVNAGPSVAYNFSGHKKMDGLSSKLSFENSNAGFKRFEAGVQMGGGIEFPFKQKRIALDIRYNYGLTNISYGREIYNRSLMISVHFSKAWKINPLGKR
jgi:hypothetical protein